MSRDLDPFEQNGTDAGDIGNSATAFNFAKRRAHTIHQSLDADNFRQRFAAEIGQSVKEFVESFIRSDETYLAVAVGSIPLGLGTSASDIDLYVVVEDAESISPTAWEGRNSDASATFVAWNRKLILVEMVKIINGLEVNIAFIERRGWSDLIAHLSQRGGELNDREITILSRLRTGWAVAWTEGYRESCDALAKSPAVDVFCCTKFYWVSMKFLEKAEIASRDRQIELATHLARTSAERACQAFLASVGAAHVGVKWISYIKRLADEQAAEGNRRLEEVFVANGLSLVLLGRPGANEDIAPALENLRDFLRDVRLVIETNVLFKIALSACAQVQAFSAEPQTRL